MGVGHDFGFADRAEGGCAEEVAVDAVGVVDVMAGEGADAGGVWHVIFEADGAGGLIVILGGGGCCWWRLSRVVLLLCDATFWWGGCGGGGFQVVVEGESGFILVGDVGPKGQSIDIFLGHARRFDAEPFQGDFAILQTSLEVAPGTSLDEVHGEGGNAD